MKETTPETGQEKRERIVTATVKKQGKSLTRFVHPTNYRRIVLDAEIVDTIVGSLKHNCRIVFVDPRTQKEICDWFNMLDLDGKLYPCTRVLADFKTCLYDVSESKVVIKHCGGIIGKKEYAELRKEVADYRRTLRNPVKAVPRRYINAQCPRCGHVFDVQISGFQN